MGLLTIIKKDTPCNEAIDLPVFYMNDFSVLGLVVENLSTASEVLAANGYQVLQKACSAKVRFEDNHHYKKIFHILQQHRINFVTSDLVDCAYQG